VHTAAAAVAACVCLSVCVYVLMLKSRTLSVETQVVAGKTALGLSLSLCLSLSEFASHGMPLLLLPFSSSENCAPPCCMRVHAIANDLLHALAGSSTAETAAVLAFLVV
jgi:hypothetical protein